MLRAKLHADWHADSWRLSWLPHAHQSAGCISCSPTAFIPFRPSNQGLPNNAIRGIVAAGCCMVQNPSKHSVHGSKLEHWRVLLPLGPTIGCLCRPRQSMAWQFCTETFYAIRPLNKSLREKTHHEAFVSHKAQNKSRVHFAFLSPSPTTQKPKGKKISLMISWNICVTKFLFLIHHTSTMRPPCCYVRASSDVQELFFGVFCRHHCVRIVSRASSFDLAVVTWWLCGSEVGMTCCGCSAWCGPSVVAIWRNQP